METFCCDSLLLRDECQWRQRWENCNCNTCAIIADHTNCFMNEQKLVCFCWNHWIRKTLYWISFAKVAGYRALSAAFGNSG